MTEIIEADKNMIGEIMFIENSSFSCPWSERSFSDAIDSDNITVNVIIHNNKICGFYCLLIIGSESELLNIAVLSEYRRKGFGTQLINHMLEFAKRLNVNIMFLEVRESNSSARNLYKKFNFSEIGIRRNYYSMPKENAVIMEKNLI